LSAFHEKGDQPGVYTARMVAIVAEVETFAPSLICVAVQGLA
jgi:hypothetical protein